MPVDASATSVQPLTDALTLRADGSVLELLSAACGACPPCRRGFRDHCRTPATPAPVVAWTLDGISEPSLAACRATLVAVEQVTRSARPGQRVGLVGSGRPVWLTRDCLLAGGVSPLIAEPEGELTKDEVHRLSSLLRQGGDRSAGPPDVVVSLDGDLALAARLVRRGGAVAAAVPATSAVPMATLVQRELTVMPSQDTADTAASSPHLATLGAWVRREDVARG